MPFTAVGGDADGVLNGTTSVDLVAAPAALAARLVKEITITNLDTVTQTITVRKTNTAGTVHRVIARADLDPGDTLYVGGEDGPISIRSTHKITGVMGAAITTTAPDWTATWGDAT